MTESLEVDDQPEPELDSSFVLQLQQPAFFAFPSAACEFVLSFAAFVLERLETFEILRKSKKKKINEIEN